MGVSPSGYYDFVNRKPCSRKCEDEVLSRHIHRIFADSYGRYGSPRVHAKLKQEGIHVGRKRVERLMKEAGLKARISLVTQKKPKLKQFQQAGENLRLTADKPIQINQQWVADVTYLKVSNRWQYLITIMDVHSRKIISWRLSKTKMADDVLIVLKRAIEKRSPRPGLIFHTDRGIEFMAYSVQGELKKHGILRSYNRLGYCTDNGHMESFYHSLKGELVRGQRFRNESELRYALQGYIDHFYNRKRLHSALGYASPVEYERIAA